MDTYKTTTDETLRETVLHGSREYPFAYYLEDVWQFDFHRIDWHWHHELEFVYASKGSILCSIGAEKIKLDQGCGLFINSGILHRFEAEDSTLTPNMVFAPTLLAPEKSLIYEKYVRPIIHAAVPYQVFEPHIPWQNCILQSMTHIFTLQEKEESMELLTLQSLLQLWELLFRHMDLNTSSPMLHRLNHQQARLQAMMQYIHEHYTEAITLEAIAEAAAISKSGALQIFQSCIHISPVAYLIQYRLAQAAEQLYTTKKTVSSIAEETGFTSSAYFCRKFRQHYHTSPAEYRRKKT